MTRGRERITSADENFRDFGWFLKWDEDFLWKRFHENLDEVCIWQSTPSSSDSGSLWIESSYATRKREVVDTERDDAGSSSREFEVSQLNDGTK